MNNKLNEHLSDETLHAWLDDELSSREMESVDVHLEQCAECSALLEQSRELCATVSQILGAYDGELANTPRVAHADRPRVALSSRVPSAPIISHIVAESRGTPLWPGVKQWMPIAAMMLVFVGGATIAMVRGYHAVTNSVSGFASDMPVRGVSGVASTNTMTIKGTVVTVHGTPLRGARVSVRETNLQTVTDGLGEFSLNGVPTDAINLNVSGVIGYESKFVSMNESAARNPRLQIQLAPALIRLNPVVITTPQPEVMSKVGSCLTLMETAKSDVKPLFRALRGRLDAPGTVPIDIVDWPAPGKTHSTKLSLLSTGQLHGVARDENARISITLVRVDGVWRGMADELLGARRTNRAIELRESRCVIP